jgi:hypothetical protein
MRITRLNGDRFTTRTMAAALLDPEVLPRLDARLQTFSGLVELLDGIRSGIIEAYGISDAGEVLGMGWGCLTGNPGERLAHVAFRRHAPALEMLRMIETVTGARTLVADIPAESRAVRLFVRRAGFRDTGPSPGGVVFCRDGDLLPCHRWVKEIERC